MRWLILAAGVVCGGATAWVVHRPVAPVTVVVLATADGGGMNPSHPGAKAEREAAGPDDERGMEPAPLGGEPVRAAGERLEIPAPNEGERMRAGGPDDATKPDGSGGGAGPLPVDEADALSPAAEQALANWASDGRTRTAATALRKAGQAKLAEAVEGIDSLRRAGQGALLRDALEEADTRWGEAVLRERDLPLGRPSAAAAEIRGRLAAAWHERALVHETRGQLAVAFAIWQRATAIDPSHLDSLAGLQRVAGSDAGAPGSAAMPQTWPAPGKEKRPPVR